jgi:hypothetical protein
LACFCSGQWDGGSWDYQSLRQESACQRRDGVFWGDDPNCDRIEDVSGLRKATIFLNTVVIAQICGCQAVALAVVVRDSFTLTSEF